MRINSTGCTYCPAGNDQGGSDTWRLKVGAGLDAIISKVEALPNQHLTHGADATAPSSLRAASAQFSESVAILYLHPILMILMTFFLNLGSVSNTGIRKEYQEVKNTD